ncbi:gamma-mobile-trio recombinase GmtY [Pseudomonas petrae]|uniref:Site-specific integrase n=1 Tax=Pseudomonas petrae TaxID=2912190 RepID=A0ABS9I7V8_9PSED|nr:gamma-mobile-trio recombinase GmtY [Pseudomonas petrae]MCF7532172.1 site-specific integrase [Pseudomonas petrae]MCF7537705.1 site-specific integrase [Pseudomonas petrae]MCF7543497.1 site-specific integrase [Pseudomonas petrae]
MPVVDVYAKVIVDESGFRSEIPVLLSEHGVVLPLLNYLLSKQTERSPDWQRRVVSSVKLLVSYMEVNQHNFSDSGMLFQSFASHLFTGTVGNDGLDPSGLYWMPASTLTAIRHINILKDFTDYLADEHNVRHTNPLVTANNHDQRLNYASWYRRNQHDFLGHIKNRTVNDTIGRARNIKGRRALSHGIDDAMAFPEHLFEQFYLDGLGSASDRRCAVRDQLIAIMMHGAGLRESQALHLWIQDVRSDPHDLSNTLIRIYHPEDGKAPDGWKSITGKANRSAYLREVYGLPPRNKLRGTRRVGWKTRYVDHRDGYIQVYWFPTDFGQLFLKLWNEHLFYLASTERHHPYAFISYEKKSLGKPYTLNAFNENYRAALARIGLLSNKIEGRSPHGHRHAYGRRLVRANIDPIMIKKALHHSNLESQGVYTAPSVTDVSEVLSNATELLRNIEFNGSSDASCIDSSSKYSLVKLFHDREVNQSLEIINTGGC